MAISFPDEDSRSMVKTLEVWVIPAKQTDCVSLINNAEGPADSGLEISNHVRLSYPLDTQSQGLDQVPVGQMVFYVEGRGRDEEVFVKGCDSVQVPATDTIQVQIDLQWTCRPKPEQCANGLDDDCDGQTDEGCQDCEQDSDCNDDNPCTIDFCTDHQCHQASFPQDTPCNDDDPCTIGDSCNGQGLCLGQQKDCSAFDGPCTVGGCDSRSGECTPVPKQDGTACDDGKWCTTEDVCVDGACRGRFRDCNDDDSCTDDKCDEGTRVCVNVLVPAPGEEGPPGDVTCSNGKDDDCDGVMDDKDANCLVCTSNADCDDNNPCTEDICLGLECENRILEDGTLCTDGLFCTVDDSCKAGACVGVLRDCNSVNAPCAEGICLEDEDRCELRPMADGTWCEDGAWCTQGDQCQAGECISGQRDCDDGDECTADTCSEVNNICEHALVAIPGAEGLDVDGTCDNDKDDDCDGLSDLDDPDCIECNESVDCDDLNPCTADTCTQGHCVNEPLNDTDCDDGNYCTVNDICNTGQCMGTLRDCSQFDDECHEGVCSESESSCLAIEKPDGTVCNDGSFCTVSDVCTSGLCSGTKRDCDDDDLCTLDGCDDDSDACTHSMQPNPGVEGPPGHGNCQNGLDDDCDGLTDLLDGDCFDCQDDDECNDNNPCTSDSCIFGLCENNPLDDGTPCDDGLYCTVSDSCRSASCEGALRDCSAESDACHEGICDEESNTCGSIQKPDGTLCSDGKWCTTNDTCLSGLCIGVQRSCSEFSDSCHVGTCDQDQDQCISVQKPDDTQCDDGLWCTTDDSCQDGTCEGSAKSCNDNDRCTIDNCDEENDRCENVLNPQGNEGDPDSPFCTNNQDDDCDGLTDLEDPDCSNCGIDSDCDDSNPCTRDACISGLCHNDSAPMDGASCDDEYWCTVADKCENAVCSGNLRNCDDYDEECGYGICDLSVDRCVVQPLPDGTQCTTGSYCLTNSTCQQGECSGGMERDCSDDDLCTIDACDEAADNCSHVFTQRPDVLDFCGDDIDQDCDGLTDGCCLTDGTYSILSVSDTGQGPWFMAASDISHDHITDIVTTNRGDDTISVLLGNGSNGRGNGSFGHRAYAVGQDPWGLAIGDLDRDHNLDVVVANNASGSVTIYWGLADGTLGSRQDLSTGAGPQQVVLADFNSDHILDIATADSSANNVGILLGEGTNGHGDRTFLPATFYPVGGSIAPRAITSGDFNSDGIVDLAVAAFNGGSGKDITIFQGVGSNGRGDGTFTLVHQYEAGSGLVSISSDDFNKDGIADLVVAAMNDNAIDVLLGQGTDGRGDGSFGSRTAYPTGLNTWPVSCHPHDMNADGILDMVIAEWGSNKISILWGNGSDGRGDGSFGSKTAYSTGTNPSSAIAFDATGDDLPDLVSCNYSGNDVTLLEAGGSSGRGDASFIVSGTLALSSPPAALLAGDFNADNITDLVAVTDMDSKLVLFLGQGHDGRGDGTFSQSWSASVGSYPRWVATTDVNSDHIDDLLVAKTANGMIGVLTGIGHNGQGTGTFESQSVYASGTSPVMVSAGDLNNDDINDMVCSDSAGYIWVLLGNGTDGVADGTFGSASGIQLPGLRSGLALGDVDEDGDQDLVSVDSSSNHVDVLLGDGEGGFTTSGQIATGSDPVNVLLEDLDNDGLLDMAVANYADSTISVRPGLGDGTFGGPSELSVGEGPSMVIAADFNEDGIMDLLSVNQTGASISVLLGQGNGDFAPSEQINLGARPGGVAMGHFDWDGKLDLAVSDRDSSIITILRGHGECSPPN